MNEKTAAMGSAFAAFVASLCCLGPLLLGSAGLGAALVATFAPLRPYFLGLSVFLLAAGFYFVYRKPEATQACEDEVCAPQTRPERMAKPLLWLAVVAVAALAFFPSYGIKLVGKSTAAAPALTVSLATAELKIAGMDCEVCAGLIQRKLAETPGVVQAVVHYSAGHATVKYDSRRVRPSQLVEVVNATGYKALLIPAEDSREQEGRGL